jgi:hypothetical protein
MKLVFSVIVLAILLTIGGVGVISSPVFGETIVPEVVFNKQWKIDQHVIKYKHAGGSVENIDFEMHKQMLSVTLDQIRNGYLRIGIPTNLLNSVAFCEETNFSVSVNGIPVSYQELSGNNLRVLEIELYQNENYNWNVQIHGTHSLTDLSEIQEEECGIDSKSPENPYWVMVVDSEDEEGIHIKSINSYVNDIGYLHIIGEVVNNQDTAYEFLKLVGTIYDERGNVLDTEFTYSEIEVIPPYGKSPFDISFKGGARSVEEYEVDAQGDKTTPLPKKLELSKPNIFQDDIGYTHIVGEVTNTGSETANFVKVIASFYNTQGELVGNSFTYTEFSDIYPGQKSSFEISENYFSEPPSYYQIYVQSNEYGMIFEKPIFETKAEPLDQIDPSHLESSPTPKDASIQGIPSWVRNNAEWWATNKINQSDFLNGIQYLIEAKIIVLPESVLSEISEKSKFDTYDLPKVGKELEITVNGIFPDYNPINPLYAKVVTPSGEEIGFYSQPVGNLEGEVSGIYSLLYNSELGEYKIIATSEGKTIHVNSFFVVDPNSSVPSWIKNNALWWSEGKISDKDFVEGIKFLIQNNILDASSIIS